MRIAEGCGRSNNNEFAVELRRVTASSTELEYLLLLAHDLSYIDEADHRLLSDAAVEVRKMASGLLKRL
jgi:four helix bundle protein